MKNPLVSVKMTAYNHAPYIAQAIEGVLKQGTSFPFELVIGEDCSTDGTREVVFDYQKRFPDIIRVITSEQNVGAKKNSYRITKACRGKYIAFCEGDDYWHYPQKLQEQGDYLEDHPKCGLVYTDYDVYDVKSEKRIKYYNKYRKREMPLNPSLCDIVQGKGGVLGGILTCTVMVRRSLLNQIVDSDLYLYQNSKFQMGDTQLWAEISHKADVFYIENSTATHNLLIESAARSEDITKRLRFSISGTEMLLYLCEKYNLPSSVKKMHERNWCDYSLRLAFRERNAQLAEQVKKKKGRLTWKEWLKYFGSNNLLIHYFLMLINYCRRQYLLRKKDSWSYRQF